MIQDQYFWSSTDGKLNKLTLVIPCIDANVIVTRSYRPWTISKLDLIEQLVGIDCVVSASLVGPVNSNAVVLSSLIQGA